MSKSKTQVLATIPLPMPMDQFVETTKALCSAFAPMGKVYVRNGNNCYEIFRYVEEKPRPQLPPPPHPPPGKAL